VTTNPPTARQLEVHDFMCRYHAEHSMWPTVREIATELGFVSTYASVCHLRALEKKGLVRHREGFARGWIAIEQKQEAA
jgi:repressor LexA